MKVPPKWIYLAIALVFFVGSAGATLWMLSRSTPSEPEFVPSPTEDIRLKAGASLVRLFDGIDGEVHTLPAEPIPEVLAGKASGDIAAEYPEWTVLELSPDRLLVKVNLSEAASAAGTRYLGIYEGKVAIYSGTPGISGRLEHLTDIEVEWLPEYEQANLRLGQEFAEHEIDMILEGLREMAASRRPAR
ncbi:MAG: hypothetical protein GX030_05905 [Firmicutes bacterium]|nr:hypothetical protein [Bacillota bacterium]